MRHSSRRKETEAFEVWYEAHGYRVARTKTSGHETFEGSGDAVWHPGKRLIWGGHGFRTDPGMFEQVADTFKTPSSNSSSSTSASTTSIPVSARCRPRRFSFTPRPSTRRALS